MMTPSKFRSSYTGPEVDRLLASIGGKIDSTTIKNDFSGGEDSVASAELAKNLNDRIVQLNDPNFFKDIFLSIPDSNLFSDDDKAKLDSLDVNSFKGVFVDSTARAASLITTSYTGIEITFLLNDGTGLQSWDYWDAGTTSWKKAKLISIDDITTVTFPVIGTATFLSFVKAEKTVSEYLIQGTKTTQVQVQKIIVTTNGTDTFMHNAGDLGNALLFDISAIITGPNVNLQVTTLTTNVVLKVRKIAEF